MTDRAHRLTDEKLEQMGKRLSAIYSDKKKELNKATEKFYKSIEEESKELLEVYNNAESREEKQKARKAYVRFYKNDVTKRKEYDLMVAALLALLFEANEKSAQTINKQMDEIYTLNYNGINQSLAKDFEGFEYREEETIKSGVKERHISKPKDASWNAKNIRNAVVLGAFLMLKPKKVFQRTINIVVKRNLDVTENGAVTMYTRAENKGRNDAIIQAQEAGYNIKKKWNAVMDNVTRQSHVLLNGVKIRVRGDFLPNLAYPGDPRAPLDEVMNCRCWLTYERI